MNKDEVCEARDERGSPFKIIVYEVQVKVTRKPSMS